MDLPDNISVQSDIVSLPVLT
uniref:Uncharacterized protein n=1 Tax=Moniliophthora roreri TaxID=221103 RepID=A0A0W0G1H3_MONRR